MQGAIRTWVALLGENMGGMDGSAAPWADLLARCAKMFARGKCAESRAVLGGLELRKVLKGLCLHFWRPSLAG
jgi:hypothetical protein